MLSIRPRTGYTSSMANEAEILEIIDAGILAVVTAIANGENMVEWSDGPIRVRKSDPAALLAALKQMKADMTAASSSSRCASVMINQGVA